MQTAHNENTPYACPDTTGVLLAGGRSLRMGSDKALLEVDGRRMFERALTFLQRLFPATLISGDRPDLATAETPAIADEYPGSALGGLHTGLRAAGTQWICVVPCDMPYLDERVVRLLLDRREGADAVIPRTHRGLEPVFALYKKSCLPAMESLLKDRQYRIRGLYPLIEIETLDVTGLPNDLSGAFVNINTPEQLAEIKRETG